MKSIISKIKKDTLDFEPRNKILGVSGSPRKNGNSDILLKNIISGVSRENVPSTALHLRNIQFQGCIGCEKCRKDKICTGLIDGMSLIYKDIAASKGLILISPSHNYNMTSWMKAFIDRLYCFYNFDNDRPRSWTSQFSYQNRKAVIAAVCEQKNKADMGFTLEAMKKPIQALGYEIVGELSVYGIFEKGGVKEDIDAMEKAIDLGLRLAKAVKE